MHQSQLSAYFGVVNKIKLVQSNDKLITKANIEKHLRDNKQNIVERETNCVRNKTRMPDWNSSASNVDSIPESRYLPNNMGFSSDDDDFEEKKIRAVPKLCKVSPKKDKTPGKVSKNTLSTKIRKRKIVKPLVYDTSEASSQNSEFYSTDFISANLETNNRNKINIISDVTLDTNSMCTKNNDVTPYEMISHATTSKTCHLITKNVQSRSDSQFDNTIYSQLTQKCPLSSDNNTSASDSQLLDNASTSNILKRKLPISHSNTNSDNSSSRKLHNCENNSTPKANKCKRTASSNVIPQNATKNIPTKNKILMRTLNNKQSTSGSTGFITQTDNEIHAQNTSKILKEKKTGINKLKRKTIVNAANKITDSQSTDSVTQSNNTNSSAQITPGSEIEANTTNSTSETESVLHSNDKAKQKNTTEINATQSPALKKTISFDVTYGENSPPKITIHGNLTTENSGYDIIIQTPKITQASSEIPTITSQLRNKPSVIETTPIRNVRTQIQSSPTTEEDEITASNNSQQRNRSEIHEIIATFLQEAIENNINDSATTSVRKPGKPEQCATKRPNASTGKTPKKKFQNDSSQMTLTQFMGKKTSKPDVIDTNSVTGESPTSPSNKKAKMDSHNQRCENVQNIINWVFEREYFKILFTKQEEDLLNKLCNIPNLQHRIVCVRLFTRLDKWYNLNNLLEELDLDRGNIHLQEMLNVLKADFVETDYSKEDVMLLLNNLSAVDIKDICASFKLKLSTNNKKPSNIALLYNHSLHQQTLTTLKTTEQILRDRVNEKLGICVKLNSNFREILNRIHLLYSFTNSNINTFNDVYLLMNRLKTGEIVNNNHKIDSTIVFDNRQQFERYYRAWNLRRQFDDEVDKKNIENQYLLCKQAFTELKELLQDQQLVSSDKYKPLFLRRFSAIWMYCTVISSGSNNLGKHHPHDMCEWLEELLKQQYYCNHKRGLWYIQLSLIKQAHLKDIPSAVEAIIEGLSDKLTTEVHKHELSFRGYRINKKKVSQMKYDQLQCLLLPPCELPDPRIIRAQMVHNNQMGRKLQFVLNTPDGKEYRSVEETAIKHYTTEENYTDGIHCEGRLLIKLFHIFFWDIIFDQYVPNTFLTELQHFPLDFSSGEFYVNRKKKIDARLNDIRELWNLDILCQFISHTLEKYAKEIASLTNILNAHSRDVTSLHSGDFGNDCSYHLYVQCIGKKVLSGVFERFVKNYKLFHSGLPDLFLWNKKELRCCFVEVKSENDVLSITQILWLNYLKSVGANVEVCRVESIGSSSRKGMKKK